MSKKAIIVSLITKCGELELRARSIARYIINLREEGERDIGKEQTLAFLDQEIFRCKDRIAALS